MVNQGMIAGEEAIVTEGFLHYSSTNIKIESFSPLSAPPGFLRSTKLVESWVTALSETFVRRVALQSPTVHVAGVIMAQHLTATG